MEKAVFMRETFKVQSSSQDISQDIHAILTYNSFFYKNPAVIMLHGFATNKNESGIFNRLAENFLKQNIASIQIDFSGWGENPQEQLVNFNLMTMVQNVVDTVKSLNKYPCIDINKLGVIGSSLGSAVAVIAQAEFNLFKTIALISPTYNLESDFKSFLGDFGEKTFLNINHREVQKSEMITIPLDWRDPPVIPLFFFKSFELYDMTELLKKLKLKLLAIAGENDFSKSNAIEISRLTGGEFQIIPGADHIFNMFDPTKSTISIVEQKIVDWMSICLQGV
jgi:pimeloyl-ACP methyl ester carboxylesterase